MKEFNFKKGYHNNPLNALLSGVLDKKRTIMDIDGVTSKIGCKTKIYYDHKKMNDRITLSTLREYSSLVKENTHCFIVRCDIDEESGEIKDNKVIIYEIKAPNEVTKFKEKNDYIKNDFKLSSHKELGEFFKVENHLDYKKKLIEEINIF